MDPRPPTAVSPIPSPPLAAAPTVQVIPVTGLPEVARGADLAALLHEALERPGGPGLQPGDVLCVSTKIVSKSLGLVIAREEKQQAIARATVRLVARRRHERTVTSVVQTPHGAVMAAAGIDGSNSPEGLLLLPEDPDAEAEKLRARLRERAGLPDGAELGVILTDTSSRIWRQGVGDIALGCAGVASLQDLRGSSDAHGRPLSVTVRDLADELAAAADLVKGKATAVPAAVVRGVAGACSPAVPARALNRLPPQDWFARPSLESVWQALGLAPEQEPIARMSPEEPELRIRRALEVALEPRDGAVDPYPPRAELAEAHRIRVRPADASPRALLAAGALAERVRTALAAEHAWSALPPVAVEIPLPGEDDEHPAPAADEGAPRDEERR